MDSIDETGLNQLDLDSVEIRNARYFRRIVVERMNVEAAKAGLRDAVMVAREEGDSWAVIGAALEMSAQDAREKFGIRKAQGGERE